MRLRTDQFLDSIIQDGLYFFQTKLALLPVMLGSSCISIKMPKEVGFLNDEFPGIEAK